MDTRLMEGLEVGVREGIWPSLVTVRSPRFRLLMLPPHGGLSSIPVEQHPDWAVGSCKWWKQGD